MSTNENEKPTFTASAGGCPVDHSKWTSGSASVSESSSCPVDHSTMNQSPLVCPLPSRSGLEGSAPIRYNRDINDMEFDQSIQMGQSENLSVQRVVSTIPKGSFTPEHQPAGQNNWVYPSEQQYYNAMRRKGYNPSETDIPSVLYIHNAVNEQGWSKIKEWEAYSGFQTPKLKRFMGKPTELSPKARMLGWIGYSLPFDRHDWIVQRDNGQEVRYVIDFYSGASGYGTRKNGTVSIYLDVRPAADSFSSIASRVTFFLRQKFAPFSLPKQSLAADPLYRAMQNYYQKKT